MEYRILGPLEVLRDGKPLALGGAKQRALLAILLVNPNQTMSTDRLIDLLWGDSPPHRAENALQVYVSQLRKALEPDRVKNEPPKILITRAPGYELAVDPGERDADVFAGLVESARSAFGREDVEAADEGLRRALALWRGPALADFAYESFAQGIIGSLEEARVAALEDRIEADLLLGRHQEIAAELAELVAQHPLRERLRRQHVIALYRCGRQADALAAYRQARQTLLDELGIDPTPALAELETAILNQTATLDAPARVERMRPAAAIPSPPTPLVGRIAEIANVDRLLADPTIHLVTLIGPGGSGKTRLAIEVARRATAFPDGVFFVPLASVADHQLVPSTIARTVGVEERAGEDLIEVLSASFASRPALLVLDNFEHVLAAAEDIARLLLSAPAITILVTSQAALRIAAEHEFPVRPLSIPDADAMRDTGSLASFDAVALFLQRATAVNPEGVSTDDGIRAAAEICKRLEGLPLAIELAAARVNVLTPRAILARLERPLSVLTAGPRDAPERHRAIRAAIQWSYELLDQDEKRFLARMSVFAGGAGIDAAERVAGEAIDAVEVLGSLVDKSLLVREDLSGEPRFRLLEMIRAYALERLVESGTEQEVRRLHAEWFAGIAGRKRLEAPEQAAWLELVDVEIDNLRAALSWTAETGEDALLARLAIDLSDLWQTRGHLSEGRKWLRLAQERSQDDETRFWLLLHESSIAIREGAYEDALSLGQDLLVMARERSDEVGAARSLSRLSIAALNLSRHAEATAFAEEAVAIARRHGAGSALLIPLNTLGNVELSRGNHGRAHELFREARSLAMNAEKPEWLATAVFNTGLSLVIGGDPLEGRSTTEDALKHYRALGDREGVAYCFEVLAAVEASEGELGEAACLMAASDELLRSVGASLELVEKALHEETLAIIRNGLRPEELEAAWARGRSTGVEEAIAIESSR